MADDFDFMKYLKENGNMSQNDMAAFEKLMWDELSETRGLFEYLRDTQTEGIHTIDRHLPNHADAVLFIATAIGQVVSFVRVQYPEDSEYVIDMLLNHKKVLFNLIATSMALGIGVAAKEEWR